MHQQPDQAMCSTIVHTELAQAAVIGHLVHRTWYNRLHCFISNYIWRKNAKSKIISVSFKVNDPSTVRSAHGSGSGNNRHSTGTASTMVKPMVFCQFF